MAAVRPPLPLRLLLLASLSMCVLTLGFAGHYTKDWWLVRRGKPASQQRYNLPGVPWFKRPFMEFVYRLQRTIPAGAKVLVEPRGIEDDSGKARWFMFLNYYAYPLEVYVRKPKLASGTLVDYPRWLRWHEEAGLRFDELLEIDDRGIEWKVRYPVSLDFRIDEVEIYQKVGAEWRPVPLAGKPPPGSRRRAELEAREALEQEGLPVEEREP